MDVESILSIYEAMYPIGGIRYVFLDEIQYTENWELWMKVIYDSRKDFRLMNIADCVSLMSLSCQIICALQSC